MTKPTFGQPPATIHELTAQATIIARAIQTLEWLRDTDTIKDKSSIQYGFMNESWEELTKLLDWFYAQGVNPKDIDYGGMEIEVAR